MAFLLHSDFLNPSVLIEELFYLHLQASAQTEGTPLNRCFGVRKEQSVVFPKKRNSLNTSMEVLGVVWFHLAWCCIVFSHGPISEITLRKRDRERMR